MAYQYPRNSDQLPPRPAHMSHLGASSASSFGTRMRSDDSWVEISSQPSSSSLSSANDEIVTTGLRVQHDSRPRRAQQDSRPQRRRTLRPGAPSTLNISARPSSSGGISSQEEYEESESESDHVMTSSGEGPQIGANLARLGVLQSPAREDGRQESSDDENKTAINYPIHNDACFTPQPNAFTYPPLSNHTRNASQPVPGSYFPSQRPPSRPSTRHSLPAQQHTPQNILSPSYTAAAQHEEALRASLSTLLSCAAAARGLPNKRPQQAQTTQPRGNRIEPMSFRLVPESALPVASASPPAKTQAFQEPTFKPTLRRASTSTTNSASPSSRDPKDSKRKHRTLSKDRSRSNSTSASASSSNATNNKIKKARRSSSADDLAAISPTLLTWVVSAGVVVVLSALSFSAGYSLGREAGRFEGSGALSLGSPGVDCGDEVLRGCAREAGRSGLGLKRSLARSAVQV